MGAAPLAKSVRKRSKAHLAFVASQRCAICKPSPCEPHHLKIAQPRSLGRKVCDEFTVPLCRTHHHELHREGNEVGWANMQVAPQASKTQICKGIFSFRLVCRHIQPFKILISFSYLSKFPHARNWEFLACFGPRAGNLSLGSRELRCWFFAATLAIHDGPFYWLFFDLPVVPVFALGLC